MQQLIANYLFTHKTCPLPGVGHLYIKTKAAESNFLDKKIEAPKDEIHFSTDEINTDAFVHFLNKKTNTTSAIDDAYNFSTTIKQQHKTKLPQIGEFVQIDGILNFTPITIADAFAPAIIAERVVHENAEHTMLVGDKETTTTAMEEYYTEQPAVKDNWWIWALVLGFVGLAAIFIYYFVLNNL